MCGIVGILSQDASVHHPDRLTAMMDVIAHRGPDDSGQFIAPPISLGFRRLSIIDIASGHQPMRSSSGRYTIVFNGEIYNFQQLRQELENVHQIEFKTQSDTEVLLYGYATWKADLFVRLNGMFAVAIWDAEERALTLARDRSGKKPLYYYHAAGVLKFASEIKPLLLDGPPPQPSPARIATSAAYRYVPQHETLFQNIEAFPPAHYAVVSADDPVALAPVPYWIPKPRTRKTPPVITRKLKTLPAQLHDLLSESVQRRLIADVPVGAFLSGGIDSSLIVALMSQHCQNPIRTFSIGFDTGFSEHHHARTVANAFSTNHHETIITASDLLREIPAVLWHRESPISEPSDIPLYILARQARKQVAVVLSGEGSDELFAGYPKHKVARYAPSFASALARKLLPVLRSAGLLKSSASPIALAMESLAETNKYDAQSRWFGAFNASQRGQILSPTLADLPVHDAAHLLNHTHPNLTPLMQMQLQDFAHWLPANLLLRGDRVTMAHSLELRCPFLDPDIINFAFEQVPDEIKIRGGVSKWLVREIAIPLLPKEITQRKKWGFKVPVSEWFRGPLKQSLLETLLSQTASDRGYFNQTYLKRLIDDHVNGHANHAKQLWFLYQLELWHLMFIDGTLHKHDTL